jgi:hypothetical protein
VAEVLCHLQTESLSISSIVGWSSVLSFSLVAPWAEKDRLLAQHSLNAALLTSLPGLLQVLF